MFDYYYFACFFWGVFRLILRSTPVRQKLKTFLIYSCLVEGMQEEYIMREHAFLIQVLYLFNTLPL